MKINDFKKLLAESKQISFKLPNGDLVPSHFHVTEVGRVQKDFIDCGGVVRNEVVANLQLWNADDYDHRLHPEKLLKIVEMSQDKLGIGNFEIEVEYQGETINKFGLEHDGEQFLLSTKMTDCLAKDNCGIPQDKMKFNLGNLVNGNSCTPGGGCC